MKPVWNNKGGRIMRKLRRYAAVLLTVAALEGTGGRIAAQTTLGSVNGVITDATGAAIPNAKVVLQDLNSGAQREVSTSVSGTYIIPSVYPGRYSLKVTATGFKTQVIASFELRVDENITQNMKMEIGELSQITTVTAEPPPLDATDATIGTTIQNKEINQIPLNGRHFTQLILLTPGAAPVETGQQSVFTISEGAGGISPSVNGMRAQMNNFTLDGVDNNMRFTNSYATSPPPDAIQEFKVESHQSDAAASLAAGANINLITRSGTNDLHGSAWEFLRNADLAANNFFTNYYGGQTLPYKQNQYGFYLGGPVYIPKVMNGRKSKTYFSTYWEGFKYRRTSDTSAEVPTQAERNGDFSALLGNQIGKDVSGNAIYTHELYDPLTTTPCSLCASGYSRQPFPNNIIPASRIQAVALAYLKYFYPLPNRSTIPNLILAQSTQQDSDQFGVRIDHDISDNQRMFERVSLYHMQQLSPGSLPNDALQQINAGANVALQYTNSFTPTFLLNVLAGYNRAAIPYRNQPLSSDFRNAVGANFAQQISTGYIPATLALDDGQFSSPSFFDFELANPDYSYQFNFDFQKVHGNHELSFGFRLMHWRHEVGYQGSSGLDFVPQTTGLPGYTATGESLASFMIGLPTASFYGFANPLQTYSNIYIGYFGDTWKIRRNLTLNVGLQYVYAPPPVAAGNRISLFDYAKALTNPDATDFSFAYLWAGTNPITGQSPNVTRRSILKPDKTDWAPRFGISYSPFRNTVIRSGFGMFYDFNTNLVQNSIRVAFNNWPYSLGQQVSGQNITELGPYQPYISLTNPFVKATPTPPAPRNTLDINNRDPYVMEWNFGVQQALPGSLVLETDYLGAASRRSVLNVVENIAPAGVLPANPRRPLPNSGSFIDTLNQGNASYNALQVSLQRRFAMGLTFRNSYTWSKSLDYESDPNAAGIEYAYNWRQSWGPSDFDIRHMDVLSGVWDLPFGEGRRYGGSWNGFTNQVLGGWEMSGILNLRTGIPYSILSGQDSANTGTFLPGLEKANILGNPTPPGFQQNQGHWFDTLAFAVPPFGTLGTSSRNFLHGPGYEDVDVALSKTFLFLGEGRGLEFRAEFFNLLNHTSFGNPDNTVISPTFGEILSAYPSRDIQFGLKLHW